MIKTIQVVVPNGGTVSAKADIGGCQIVGVDIPPIDSGNVTFDVSVDAGQTWRALQKETLDGVLTISAGSGNMAVIINMLVPFRWIRAVCVAAQSGGARTFTFVAKRIL